MPKTFILLTLSFLQLMFSTVANAGNLPAVIAQVKPSVVAIAVFNPTAAPRLKLIGSGFVVAPGNKIVTNHHVIEKTLDSTRNERYVVLSGHGTQPVMHAVLNKVTSREHDLAVLTIEQILPAMPLAKSGLIEEGTEIAFTGYPITGVLGLYPATHRGIISSVTPIAIPADNSTVINPRTLRQLQQPFMVYQLDATAYPGNSGSAVYRQSDGHVVAIINMVLVKSSREAVLSDPSGISYAIPVQHLHTLLQQP